MVYGRYRRYNRRGSRSFRRRNSRLSTSKVLTRKSATSQARQILALNRKINNVYRATRPEIKIFTSITRQCTFTNGVTSSTYQSYILKAPESNGTNDYQFIGNQLRVKDITFYINCEYNITGNNETSEPSFHLGEASHAGLRFIVIRPKSSISSSSGTPSLSQVLTYNASSGNDYDLRMISPFAVEFSNNYRLLADVKIPLDVNTPEKSRRVKVRGFTLRFNGESANNATYPIVYVVTSGLHADANFTDQIQCTWAYKIAYTDA